MVLAGQQALLLAGGQPEWVWADGGVKAVPGQSLATGEARGLSGENLGGEAGKRKT